MTDCNGDLDKMNDGCKLYINQHTEQLKTLINDGFSSVNNRLLNLEISVNNQVPDITSLKTDVYALKNGNGKMGHNALVKEFEEHKIAHERTKEKVWQLFMNYGGKVALILFNVFVAYKILLANNPILKDSQPKQHTEQKP